MGTCVVYLVKMTANLIGCAILLLVLVKSGNAISGREEIKQVEVIGAGNCTYDMDCPGEHPCCVLEDKETVCGVCTSYYKGVCMRCDTSQPEKEGTPLMGSELVNNQLKDNCTYDMDCPGDHPCCTLVDKATMCGKCKSYYKGVCMNCNVGGEVDVVFPREKTDIS